MGFQKWGDHGMSPMAHDQCVFKQPQYWTVINGEKKKNGSIKTGEKKTGLSWIIIWININMLIIILPFHQWIPNQHELSWNNPPIGFPRAKFGANPKRHHSVGHHSWWIWKTMASICAHIFWGQETWEVTINPANFNKLRMDSGEISRKPCFFFPADLQISLFFV